MYGRGVIERKDLIMKKIEILIFVRNVDVSSTYGTSTGGLGYRLGFELGYWGSKISKPLGFKPPRKTIS